MVEIGIAVVVALLAAAVFYVRHVSGEVSTAASLMDKTSILADAKTTWGKIDAKLLGWKTIILAWIAALAQIVQFVTADVVTEWKDLPWAQVFDAKVANAITLVCTFLIPIVHARGMITAAKSTPPSSIAS